MKECKQCGGKVYSVGSSVHQTCRDEYIETLTAENKALRGAIEKHKAGFEEPDFGTVEDKELWTALTKEEL